MSISLSDAPPAPPTQAPERPHAIVIGSGFGGLAAAVRLGALGYRVTILEHLPTLGGRARVHRQDGFTFDAGPTIITAPFLLEELWALCGKKLDDAVELRPITPFYRFLFDDGTSFDYTGDPAGMRDAIAAIAPKDVAGYQRFMRASEAIFRVGFEQLGDVPFSRWTDMARIIPTMLRLRSYRSVHGLVASYVKHPKLRIMLSFHPLLVGGNPFAASSIYSLICFLERNWGVHFAMGGTGRLVDGLATLIAGQGSTLRTNATVTTILTTNNRAHGVQLATGERIPADIIVSNADATHTYTSLLAQAPRRRWTNRKLARARQSMGLFVWYFGTSRQFPDVAHHTILLGPRYRGLLDDIFKHRILAEDFSLYLHRPTATDPSLAPPGCDAFYVLSPVPHLAADIDWRREAEPYRRRIEAALAARLLPGLADCVVTSRVTTPLDFRDDLLSAQGAAFGLEPLLTQSAWFRPHNASEDFENLYLVGAGTHPGAGVPGVLSSARILDRVVPNAVIR
jgi:phytoene desaturase